MNDLSNVSVWVDEVRNAKREAKGCFCRSEGWVLLGNGKGDIKMI